jgi:copper chaperone CopZ
MELFGVIMNRRLIFSFALACLLPNSLAAHGEGAKAKSGATISASSMISNTASKASYNAAALHRLDFKVVGKSCAVCLLGIQRRMGLVPGVVKVAVQLKKPYAATVIYDSSKTGKEKILAKAKEGLSDLETTTLEDEPISKLPTILIPKIGNEAVSE